MDVNGIGLHRAATTETDQTSKGNASSLPETTRLLTGRQATHYSGFPLVTFTVPCDSVYASNKLQQPNVYVYTYVCTWVYIGSMHMDKTIA